MYTPVPFNLDLAAINRDLVRWLINCTKMGRGPLSLEVFSRYFERLSAKPEDVNAEIGAEFDPTTMWCRQYY